MELGRFLNQQICTVDNLLLNAYGTVYKLAVKNVEFKKRGIQLSETEEILSAKNLLTNLWSVLDYCCIILYCKCMGRRPSHKEARKICFPCDFKLATGDGDPEDWEKNKIREMFGDDLADKDYQTFKGTFSDIQLKTKDDEENETIKVFYLLHYLRNFVTHNAIDIIKVGRPGSKPILVQRYLPDAPHEVAITIGVPKHPWSEKSCDDRSSYESMLLLDVLWNACELVKDRRDRMLLIANEAKFSDKIKFHLTSQKLKLSLFTSHSDLDHCELHLECYGMEADFREELESLRSRK